MTTSLHTERNLVYSTPSAGVSLTLDIHRPAQKKNLPVIMLVHGGGWCTGAKLGVEFARPLVDAGYLVADIDYRLAPAFLFPSACRDVTAAAAWLVDHVRKYGGDPTRIGGYGVSAGAHLITWLTVQRRTPLACAVAWAGPMDMRKIPVTHPYRGYPLAFMGACPHDDPKAYRRASPIFFVTRRMPPLLLIHGKDDTVVTWRHARWMLAATRKVGAPCEILLLDGVGHTGADSKARILRPGWRAMMNFYTRHLRP
jgi:acetyl esterase/lipase